MENKPIKKHYLGGITAAVWNNQTKDGKVYETYTFQKSYKTAEGEWKNTSYFSLKDLASISSLCQKLVTEELNVKDENDGAPF